MLNYMLISNDPIVAKTAEACGVNRIFIDLEQIGKKKRQGHLNTLISSHTLDDINKIKPLLDKAELLVRLNPMHEKTSWEIEGAIARGADILMLPMFRTYEELFKFCTMVDSRVRVMPLVETASALKLLPELMTISGISEFFIGLNDLHLDLKMNFIFMPLINGLLEQHLQILKDKLIPFGFGGIARINEGTIPAEIILGEHIRLGSTSVILSRTFNRQPEKQKQNEFLDEFAAAFLQLREHEQFLRKQDQNFLNKNRLKLISKSHELHFTI